MFIEKLNVVFWEKVQKFFRHESVQEFEAHIDQLYVFLAPEHV